MNVLGVIAFGKTPAACLLRDGKLVAFGEEERFTRLKGSHGMFPAKAVQYCLDEAGIDLGGVDRIAFAWDAGKYPYHMLGSLGRQYMKYRGAASRAWRHCSSPAHCRYSWNSTSRASSRRASSSAAGSRR